MIAVIICAVAVARYSNVFDYVGPNMAANQLNVYSPPPAGTELFSPGQNGPQTAARHRRASQSQEATSHAIAAPVGATHVVELDQPGRSACRTRAGTGRQWNGPIYVATPALLRAYGINPSSIPSNVDILSSRPGLLGLGRAADLRRRRQGRRRAGRARLGAGRAGAPVRQHEPCTPGSCVAHPVRPGGEPAAHRHVGPEHGDHRECAAPAARGETRTASGAGLSRPTARSRGPDHERPTRWRPPAT